MLIKFTGRVRLFTAIIHVLAFFFQYLGSQYHTVTMKKTHKTIRAVISLSGLTGGRLSGAYTINNLTGCTLKHGKDLT